MRWIKRLAFLLLFLIISLVAIAFFLPSTAHVQREIMIARPPADVFALMSDLSKFNQWSPWFKYDPNAKYEFSGPQQGVGASMGWVGDPSTVGTGRMTITRIEGQNIYVDLDFGPMGQPKAAYLIEPASEGSKVVWTFDAQLPLTLDRDMLWNLVGRYMGLFFDRMIGKDYEQGLADLKKLMETK